MRILGALIGLIIGGMLESWVAALLLAAAGAYILPKLVASQTATTHTDPGEPNSSLHTDDLQARVVALERRVATL